MNSKKQKPNKESDSYPEKLLELEQFIAEIQDDIKHPLNNPKHPQHTQVLNVYNTLVETAEALRHAWLTAPESKKSRHE